MNRELAPSLTWIEKIHNDEEYDQIHGKLHLLIDLGFENLTSDQEAILDHLANLIEAYDQEQILD